MTWNPGASLPLPPPDSLQAPTTPARRPENVGVIILCWVVIIGVVAFVGIGTWRTSHDQRMERAVGSVEMELSARPAIGSLTIVRLLPIHQQVEGSMPDLVARITSSAVSPKQKLMAVAVAGELQGKAAALARLDKLDPDLKALSDVEDGPDLRKDAASLRRIYAESPDALSAAAAARLEVRLGWFGRLALVAGLPDTDPERSDILRACERASIAGISAELFLLALLIAGIVLLIIAIYKLATGTLYLNYKPAPQAGTAFLEMFTLYIVGFVSVGAVARAMHVKSELAVYGVVSIWIAGCCCWPLLRGLTFRELRKGLGWTTCRGVLTEVAMGIVGYITFFPLVVLAVLVSTLLIRIANEHPIHPIVFEASNQSKFAIIGLYVLASGFAPAVEETMFRGALFHHLRRRHRWLLSAALSAVIFAAVHPQGWSLIPVIGGIGFTFAGIREWRGNVIASGTAHALHNGFLVTMMLLILG